MSNDNVTVISCGRGKRCAECGASNATSACRFELKGPKLGKSCDRPLCERCAGKDGMCGAHYRISQVKEKKTTQVVEPPPKPPWLRVTW